MLIRTWHGEPGGHSKATAERQRNQSAVRPIRIAARTGNVIVAIGDALALLGALLVVAVASTSWSLTGLALTGTSMAVLNLCGMYQLPLTLRALEVAPALTARLAVPVLVLGVLGNLSVPVLVQALIGTALVVAGRCATYTVVRRLRRARQISEPVLLVGGGKVAAELAQIFSERGEYGLVPIGCVDSGPGAFVVPRLGPIEDLPEVIRAHAVSRVVVAFSTTPEHDLVDALRVIVMDGVTVHIVPRFFEIAPPGRAPHDEEIWGIPLHRVKPCPSALRAWRVKRALDVVGATLGLVVTSPVLLAVAIAVRLSSPGPILFRQLRIGQHDQPFELVKFRTMAVNTDSDVTWSVDDDLRVTGVGRFLRASGIDELPQLWNILRADMSLIGPRPERPHFARQFAATIPGYRARHRVPVGLTGLAQVNGLRGDTSIAERARFDNRYIEGWSLWRDLVILLSTVATFSRRGPR